ncbi:MAG: hypothetical protein M5U26_26855 [Planctomycetota bacterium]|nr:hypothetical protein [Planctomycetota bacterium]
MSVNEAYVYVKSSSDAAVVREAGGELRRWVREVCPKVSPQFDDPADWGADSGWRRQLLHLPSQDEWTLLIDTALENSDPELARRISKALKTTAVWCLLLGGCYHWRFRIYDNGREVKSGAHPESMPPLRQVLNAKPARAGDESGKHFAEGAMPLYQDAEAEVYHFLGDLGVPATLRMVTHDIRVPAEVAREAGMTYQGTLLTVDGVQAGMPELKVVAQALVEPPGGGIVPISFDGVARDKEGRRFFLERRRVFGEPSPEALGRLLEVEREVRNRYEYPFLELADKVAPEMRFSYVHGGLGKGELDRRLQVRRRVYERLNPSKREFLRLAFKVLKQRWPTLKPGARAGFGFQMKPPTGGRGSAWVIRLDNAYEEYRARPGDLAPAAFLARFFERLFGTLLARPLPNWDAAKSTLLPRLRGDGARGPASTEALDAIARNDLPVVEAGAGLQAGLVSERDQGLVHVHAAALKSWKVELGAAYAAALANLGARTPAGLEGARLDAERGPDGGRVCVVSYGDGHSAARVLLPEFRRALLARLGDKTAIVSFADRDALRAAAESDLFGMELLRQDRRRAAGQAPELFRITAEGVARYEGWED